ncbi:MAG: sigma-54-dependent Fis family transcriptional regulator [Desulfovibrionaceae bacterium]|nr:sigma-54-dependent Fis family transcriptional regulator [Desulfovibrionaceae bacterium]
MSKILIVDDDKMMCRALCEAIQGMGFTAEAAHSLKTGLEMSRAGDYAVVILDVWLPDGNGLDILPRIKEGFSAPEVIILTGSGDPDGAELAVRCGAWSYITKPPTLSKIRLPVQRALEYHRTKRPELPPMTLKRSGIVGECRLMLECLERIGQASQTQSSVLITGETGTGKELFARAIHDNSDRRDKAFVVVDCAALPENLAESILFGHEKGSFTSADRKFEGLIKLADNGTLFLDEVGELPLSVQKTFLRVLQTRAFRPVGGAHEVGSDFRLVAATNKDLEDMVEAGGFRRDLLFRLRTVTVSLPSLRDRGRDVRKLFQHFLGKYCRLMDLPMKRVSSEYLDGLMAYDWPGNVRELINCVESSLSTAGRDMILFQKHLPMDIRIKLARSALQEGPGHNPEDPAPDFGGNGFPMLKDYRTEVLARVEERYLRELMSRASGRVGEACAMSGLSRARLYALMKRHGVSRT